jgi:hypothetical protein
MSVTAVVGRENLRDGALECFPRVRGQEPGLMVEERRAGQTCDLQQDRERVISLEGNEGLNLHRRS